MGTPKGVPIKSGASGSAFWCARAAPCRMN